MDLFYRINSSSVLTILNNSLNESNSKGLYLEIGRMELDNEKEKKYKTTSKEIDVIQTLNKDIIITFDYNKHFRRPHYYSPSDYEKNMKDLKKKLDENEITDEHYKKQESVFDKYIAENKERIKHLVSLTNREEALKEYKNLKNKVSLFIKRIKNKSGTLRVFLPAEKSSVNIRGWEMPFICNFPEDEIKNDEYLLEIQNHIDIINQYFVEFASKEEELNVIYPISMMLGDISNDAIVNKHLENMHNFEDIIVWIINFNELYKTKFDNIQYFGFLSKLAEKKKIYVKYCGIQQFHQYFNRLKEINVNNVIFREDGYSGYNINIRRNINAFNTRDFLDVNTLTHLNEQGISKKEDGGVFLCKCSECQKRNVRTYGEARLYYFSTDITKDESLERYIMPKRQVKDVEKYKKNMAKDFQSKRRKIHNFEATDRLLSMPNEEFFKTYKILTKKWEEEKNE